MRRSEKLVGLIMLCSSSFAFGNVDGDMAQKGLMIAQQAAQRDNGFGDNQSSLTMTLRNQHGDETIRLMRNKTLEQINEGDKSLITFDNPRDVKGTSFLSFTHKVGSDDQWLYLPALKRVKRISSSNQAGPFMGSEFAFEDIASQEVEKYTYRYIKEDMLNTQKHHVIERDPIDKKSGYSKQIVWIDQTHLRNSKIEYYDRKGTLLKTLTMSDYQLHLNQFWRANSWAMINHQTGKSTDLQFTNWQFKTGLKDKDFTKNSLKRAK